MMSTMKIYSWKTLLVTILIGGGLIIYEFKNIMAGEMSAIFPMIFWGYVVIKGLWVSFTEEGFQIDQRNEEIGKTVMKKLFGSWAFIAQWGGIILIVLPGIGSQIIPSQKWYYIFILGLVYQIIFSLLVAKHIKIERRKYF